MNTPAGILWGCFSLGVDGGFAIDERRFGVDVDEARAEAAARGVDLARGFGGAQVADGRRNPIAGEKSVKQEV